MLRDALETCTCSHDVVSLGILLFIFHESRKYKPRLRCIRAPRRKNVHGVDFFAPNVCRSTRQFFRRKIHFDGQNSFALTLVQFQEWKFESLPIWLRMINWLKIMALIYLLFAKMLKVEKSLLFRGAGHPVDSAWGKIVVKKKDTCFTCVCICYGYLKTREANSTAGHAFYLADLCGSARITWSNFPR